MLSHWSKQPAVLSFLPGLAGWLSMATNLQQATQSLAPAQSQLPSLAYLAVSLPEVQRQLRALLDAAHVDSAGMTPLQMAQVRTVGVRQRVLCECTAVRCGVADEQRAVWWHREPPASLLALCGPRSPRARTGLQPVQLC